MPEFGSSGETLIWFLTRKIVVETEAGPANSPGWVTIASFLLYCSIRAPFERRYLCHSYLCLPTASPNMLSSFILQVIFVKHHSEWHILNQFLPHAHRNNVHSDIIWSLCSSTKDLVQLVVIVQLTIFTNLLCLGKSAGYLRTVRIFSRIQHLVQPLSARFSRRRSNYNIKYKPFICSSTIYQAPIYQPMETHVSCPQGNYSLIKNFKQVLSRSTNSPFSLET